MKAKYSIDQFYESLRDINIINEDLDSQRRALKDHIDNFNIAFQAKAINENITKQNPEIAKMLSDTLAYIKNSIDLWLKNLEEGLKSEKFRSDLCNYFIIIIFGKVKAGKSSLGNFIAEHRPPNQKVQFFKYDEAGKEQSTAKLEEMADNKFTTDNLECTISIQGFKLDGMAWIDTPGLGSMTPENGALAKKYIQAADYIIYPTSSDSPMQQDETKQLKELFEQNKKVTVCITKSDKIEEDQIDQTTRVKVFQNKSSADRAGQEKYVNDEISKIIQNDKESILGDVYSISAHAASKGLKESDEALLENSNMPKFYELITKVVKEKSAKLKQNAPYDGLKSFIENDILGIIDNEKGNSIVAIRNKLDEMDIKISESLERFGILKENANNDLKVKLEDIVSEYESKIDKSNTKEILTKIDEHLHKEIVAVIQKNIAEIFTDFSTVFTGCIASFSADKYSIEDTYETISVSTKKRNSAIGASLLGAVATVATGFALASNPVGWVIAGTTAAGLAGSYIGGEIGEMTASEETEKVRTGDNKAEVIHKFKADRLKHYESIAKGIYIKLEDAFFVQLQNILRDMSSEIYTLEQNIKNI